MGPRRTRDMVSTMARKARKAKPAMAQPIEEAPAPRRLMSIGTQALVLHGKASIVCVSGAIDGRLIVWICKPDGTRVERTRVWDLDEAEARAQALLDKGRL